MENLSLAEYIQLTVFGGFACFIPAISLLYFTGKRKLHLITDDLSEAAIRLFRLGGAVMIVVASFTITSFPDDPAQGIVLLFMPFTQLFWIRSLKSSRVARLIFAFLTLAVLNVRPLFFFLINTEINRSYLPMSPPGSFFCDLPHFAVLPLLFGAMVFIIYLFSNRRSKISRKG